MEPVYGRKRASGRRETWMDRFTRLEPAGGFRSAVELAWNHGAVPSGDGVVLSYFNGTASAAASARAAA
jgi:hypothetical protein